MSSSKQDIRNGTGGPEDDEWAVRRAIVGVGWYARGLDVWDGSGCRHGGATSGD